MSALVARIRRWQTAISVTMLASLAFLPSLTASPGRMPTDSKLYVYLDPARFIGDTTTTFDPRQFAGWVPHQHIAYLWPTGPWYWVFDVLGAPDWVAHRLWIGTLLVAAGLGVRWMLRVLGFNPLAALAGALVYQLSPYLLPYVSRTSVLLLPFAGLGWIVGLTILATRSGRWRHPAGIALVVLTVGAVNATALAMIIPAPVIWLVHATWNGTTSWRRAAAVAGRVALLSTGVSLWWIAMLVIQGRHGADVLAYSESLESVSFTSTSTEVVRGLGYWLFYVRDAFAATTTASLDHLVSGRVVAAGYLLTAVCLAGIVFVRSPHRRLAGLLVGVGVVLAVGAHPLDDPSPAIDALVGDGAGGLALALRSSTRAVPVMLVGFAIGAATFVTAAGTATRRTNFSTIESSAVAQRAVAAAVVGVLAVVNLPALRTGGFVDPALERDQDPPAHWIAAAAALDARPDGYRVLQLPGAEFGAFEWGLTVDQPLPGLTERALLTRDLLPLGSPAAMDLIFALDDRVQEGTLEPAAVAGVARLLGADTIWVAGDVAFDRFGVARPEVVTSELTGESATSAGLVDAQTFGEPSPVAPTLRLVDAETLGDRRIGEPIAPITLVTVDDPVPTVRVKDRVVLLSGSGDGLIDAAAAGLIDGGEAVLYTASIGDDTPGVSTAQRLIVTDSNRDRAHHWRSSQDVVGFTESGGPTTDVLDIVPSDQRLAVFERSDAPTQTVSIQRGPVVAAASAYGEPFAYLPEHRPVMAIDGDPSTAWIVADRSDPLDQFIRLEVDDPIDHLDLLQPPVRLGQRRIDAVTIRVDDRAPLSVDLDERSLVGAGQRVELDPTSGPSVVTVTIASTVVDVPAPGPPIADALAGVGFAEIGTGLAPTTEWIRPPIDGVERFAEVLPTDHVFTRLRTEPTDRWRDDTEPALLREFATSGGDARLDVTIRLNQRASLASLLGEPVTDNRHLTGVPEARGAAAVDGDPTTSWITTFVDPVGSSLTMLGEGSAASLTFEQPDGDFSPITALRVDDGGEPLDIALAPQQSTVELPRAIDLDSVTITIVAVDERFTIDRRFGEPFLLPAALAEIRFDDRSPAVAPPDRLVADCRADLLTLDGDPVPLSFDVPTADAIAGRSFEATLCEPSVTLAAGVHRLRSAPGRSTGFDIDRVVVSQVDSTGALGSAGAPAVDPTTTVLVDSSRRSRTIEVPACPDGCWLVVGEGYNTAWAARTADGVDLGDPVLIDGNANGWWIEPRNTPDRVEVAWTAQQPLNIAFALSLLSILAALALAFAPKVFPRFRVPGKQLGEISVDVPEVRWLSFRRSTPGRHTLVVGLASVVVAALTIGWMWGLGAALVWTLAAVLRRLDLVAAIGWAIVLIAGIVVTDVVRTEKPFPNAGWPVRFEWLHGWTLLGVVLLACATVLVEPDER